MHINSLQPAAWRNDSSKSAASTLLSLTSDCYLREYIILLLNRKKKMFLLATQLYFVVYILLNLFVFFAFLLAIRGIFPFLYCFFVFFYLISSPPPPPTFLNIQSLSSLFSILLLVLFFTLESTLYQFCLTNHRIMNH